MFFGKHLFIVLDIEGSKILTLYAIAALENVQLSLQLHLAALTPSL